MRLHPCSLAIACLFALPTWASPLVEGFVTPPDAARPRVWWHWMNGNVSASGIRQDLAWMKRAGLGGLQQFDGDLFTPQIVAERAVYGGKAWQSNLRLAASEAARLGLEFTIAGSPGWSETGGPWVTPEQAMKKLVWSELTVEGGATGALLPSPPSVAGPYMDVPAHAESADAPLPHWYRDIAVLAVPAEAAAPAPARIISRDGADVTAQLSNGKLDDSVQLSPQADGVTWVTLSYAEPTSFQALSLSLPAARGFGTAPLPEVMLQASQDGEHFSDVAPVPLSTAPHQTIAFAARTARYWRIRLAASASNDAPPATPGVMLPPFGKAATAFPLAEVTLHAQPRIHQIEEKAGFAAATDYYAIGSKEAVRGIAPRDIIDVTRFLRADGRLDWTAPPGRWTLLRFGYSLTGKQNAPAPREATGLEVDKLSARHVRSYLDEYLGRVEQAVGSELIGRRGLGALLNDSIESGPQNWTDDMPAAFLARRGYALTHWLPAITGRVVDDAAASERFLWDFRQTISELVTDGHYATIAQEAHKRGLKVYGEALEDKRPQLGDDMDMRHLTDVPMAAMWTVPAGATPRPSYVADVQGAASVAHVWGQNLVAAESMTAFGQPWAFAPRDLKKTADIEFALGVNRIVIHTSAHQPLDGVTPGLSLAPFLGQYFSRHETWAEQARPWIDYLARTSFMLQQGRHVADIAYFYGEEAPITGLYGTEPNRDIPAGYGFDYVNLNALRQQFSVEDGRLASRSGARYRLLYLGGSSARMTVAALENIARLVRAGAVVVGKRPLASPSLADDAGKFKRLADSLWGTAAGTGVRTVGRGSVDGGGDLAAALKRLKLTPAVQFDGAADDIMVTQRHSKDHEVYFIANTGQQPRELDALFRDAGGAHGGRPEVWLPDSGCIAAAGYRQESAGLRMPLKLAAQQSLFVVIPRAEATAGRMSAIAEPSPWTTLEGDWQLRFAPGRGAPAAPLTLPQLTPWNQSEIAGIRYYSGTATYSKTFQLPPGAPARAILDLGDVRDLASVRLNGKPVGTAWQPPYRFDLGALLQAGENRLEIDVTNLWVNRLIGDAQPDAESVTRMSGVYTADAPLRASGMTGPVRLLSAPLNTCVGGVAL